METLHYMTDGSNEVTNFLLNSYANVCDFITLCTYFTFPFPLPRRKWKLDFKTNIELSVKILFLVYFIAARFWFYQLL